MKKIIHRIIIIFIMISTMYITRAYATGSFNISASKSTINKGESVTISIKANNAYGQVDIEAKNATVNPSSVFLQTGSDTKTVTVTSTSDADIEVTAKPGSKGLGDIDENPITTPQKLTIKVNKQSSDTSSNNNPSTANSESTSNGKTGSKGSSNGAAPSTATANKSTEARLKNMGIKEKTYDFTGFKRDRKEYSIEVPNKITSLTVYATPVDSKAKVVGTGKVTLKEGDNTVTVTVTAEAGNTETYNLKIKRKTAAEEASGDKDETLTDNVSGAFGLSSLDIDDVNLSPGFDTEIYQYTSDLTKDLTSLEIETIPTADDTTVEIFGNENLHEGENLITILVKNKKTGQTATYQITVNKNLQSTDVEGEGSEQVEEFSWLKPSTWGKEEIIKVAIVSVLIVLIIIAIILKVKLHKEKKAEKGIDLPGADELDRAIMEHQELSELDEFGEFEDKTMDEFNNDTDRAIDNNYDNQNLTNDYYDNTNYIEDIAKSRKNESNLDLDYPDDLNYQEYQDYPEEKSDKILKKKGKGKHF